MMHRHSLCVRLTKLEAAKRSTETAPPYVQFEPDEAWWNEFWYIMRTVGYGFAILTETLGLSEEEARQWLAARDEGSENV